MEKRRKIFVHNAVQYLQRKFNFWGIDDGVRNLRAHLKQKKHTHNATNWAQTFFNNSQIDVNKTLYMCCDQ